MTKIIATSVPVYDLVSETGMPMGRFIVEDKWEGLAKLRQISRPDGRGEMQGVVIIDDPEPSLGFFTRVFSGDTKKECDVVRASPDLVPVINGSATK